MQAAYNAAWVQLLAGAAVITPQRGEMKNKLAQVILAAACTGKRDKERLEDVALRALARRQSAKL